LANAKIFGHYVAKVMLLGRSPAYTHRRESGLTCLWAGRGAGDAGPPAGRGRPETAGEDYRLLPATFQ